MIYPRYAFHDYGPYGHQKYDGIQQGCHYSKFLVPVGEFPARLDHGHPDRKQGDQQTEYIAEIMSCIREESDRIRNESDRRLDDYEKQVQNDA